MYRVLLQSCCVVSILDWLRESFHKVLSVFWDLNKWALNSGADLCRKGKQKQEKKEKVIIIIIIINNNVIKTIVIAVAAAAALLLLLLLLLF